MAELIRGWIIGDGERTINSLDIEKNGIICIAEDNVDNKSFANTYIYNDESKTYSIISANRNQTQFTIKFLVTTTGTTASNTLTDLRIFFDKPGAEFSFLRNIYNVKNTFVVDSITMNHLSGSPDDLGFAITASYVGRFSEYPVVRETVIFDGTIPMFEFNHDFTIPEPSTVFDDNYQHDFEKMLYNNTGSSLGIRYDVQATAPFDTIQIANENHDEMFRVYYPTGVAIDDRVIFDTEVDNPVFTVTHMGVVTNLLPFVDYEVSVLPMLYNGENMIRLDLTYQGEGVDDANAVAYYWNRGVIV